MTGMQITWLGVLFCWAIVICRELYSVAYQGNPFGYFLNVFTLSLLVALIYILFKKKRNKMQYKIWKFELAIAPRQFIEMPVYADILTLGVGDELNDDGSEYPDHPVIWAKSAVNDTVPERMMKREFGMVRTDDAYDTGTMIWKYLGTVNLQITEEDDAHYHIFEIKQRSN